MAGRGQAGQAGQIAIIAIIEKQNHNNGKGKTIDRKVRQVREGILIRLVER
jgi:hypothetical protein